VTCATVRGFGRVVLVMDMDDDAALDATTPLDAPTSTNTVFLR